MSRIGRKAIVIPEGVTLNLNQNKVSVSGKLGQEELTLPNLVSVDIKDGRVTVFPKDSSDQSRALQGLSRMLLQNLITGVNQGFERRLEIHGVGYRAAMQGRDLILSMGYSHPVEIKAPEGINFKVEKNVIVVTGNRKDEVGNIAAKIRAVRPPEPYKGKGIKYKEEVIHRKAGKTGKAVTK